MPRSAVLAVSLLCLLASSLLAAPRPVEVSDDGHETVVVETGADDQVIMRSDEVPYGTAPDWQNTCAGRWAACRWPT